MTAASVPILRENRDYLRYLTAWIVSNTGTAVSTLAFPLLVLALGGGTVEASLIATCSLGLRVSLRIVGGGLADRFNRRWLMLAGDLIRLAALGSVPLTALLGSLTYAQILAVAITEGTASALLFRPASAVAVRDIVPRKHLVAATSRMTAAEGIVNLIGPAVGGVLFAVGRMLPFEVDAASYLVSAMLLLGLNTAPQRPRGGPGRDRGWSAGVRWLRGQPVLLRCLAAGTVLNVAGEAMTVVAVVGQHEHGASSTQIGAVMTAVGVGMVLGSLLAPRVVDRIRTTVWFAATGSVWAFGFALLALTSNPWVMTCGILLITGITPFGNIGLSAAVTGGIPRHLIGRVTSVLATVTGALACLGPVVGGALLAAVGVSGAWLVLAVLSGLSTVLLILPLVRVVDLITTVDGDEGEGVSARTAEPGYDTGARTVARTARSAS